VIDQLQHVAPSDASILIIGETGTGKEVVARKIHERSGRSGPFVAVNCGALSEGLGEAALFGNEAGAYTGANGARPGWFEAANGGTLFLDEIGDLPLSLQVALLRVLQERQVVRLGSRKPIPIDVRVIAATNIDVSNAVSNGRFRLDLYFRLSVVTMDLPSLRQRAGDILPLAEHFIAVYSARLKRPQPRLDAEAQQALLNYSWPGNIRQLENVIHAAVLVSTDGVIRLPNLRLVAWPKVHAPNSSTQSTSAPTSAALAHEADPTNGPTHVSARQPDGIANIIPHLDQLFSARQDQILENIESLVIHRAMEYCKGNQVHTARLLGISRNVLRTYLKRFGLIGAEPAAESSALHAAASRQHLSGTRMLLAVVGNGKFHVPAQ
jgi:sigma-54-specific transcriptional regulator